ncbi:MAG: hypothetical protein IAE96_06055 [Chitinophagaceae bacterium]|nr:hypothetical protein [Chitinophagaceae bacterium]
MKRLLYLGVIFLLCSSVSCRKSQVAVFKGKLEVAGICMNYTVSLQEGNIDSNLLVPQWTDSVTGLNYRNVFRLGSPCTFPAGIRQGDEFYFILDKSPQNCAVCLAYYPTPPKSLGIKVVQP